MNNKRVYKELRNKKTIEVFYRTSDGFSYTIRLEAKGNLFQLHTYRFEGNDVSEESNYKDEKVRIFQDFEILMETIEKEYPGLNI